MEINVVGNDQQVARLNNVLVSLGSVCLISFIISFGCMLLNKSYTFALYSLLFLARLSPINDCIRLLPRGLITRSITLIHEGKRTKRPGLIFIKSRRALSFRFRSPLVRGRHLDGSAISIRFRCPSNRSCGAQLLVSEGARIKSIKRNWFNVNVAAWKMVPVTELEMARILRVRSLRAGSRV